MVDVQNVEKGPELQRESNGVLTSKFQHGVKVCSVLLELKSYDDTYSFIYLFLRANQKRHDRTRVLPPCVKRNDAYSHGKYLGDVSEEPMGRRSREKLEVSLRRPLPDEQGGEFVDDEDEKQRADQLTGGEPADRSELDQSLPQRHASVTPALLQMAK